MIQFGNVPANEEMPFHEKLTSYMVTGSLQPSTSQTIEFDNYTMPFAGQLVCTIEFTTWWEHYQSAAFMPASPTPAPASANFWQVYDMSPGYTYVVNWCQMRWTGLGAGQLVHPYMAIGNGAAATIMTFDNVSINWRGARE